MLEALVLGPDYVNSEEFLVDGIPDLSGQLQEW
jgi:hypothetical protein